MSKLTGGQTLQTKKGFTIIEVLIVLAIDGMILLIVLLAVPALQRNARNVRRKNDVRILLGAVQDYMSIHQGQFPTTSTDITNNMKLSVYETTDVTLGDIAVPLSTPNPENFADI